ncbi:MAG: GNAT family N-acetyltransferase [Brotaphodocola sp.]
MIYRFAEPKDLKRLTELAEQAIAGFRARGIDQWQKGAPNEQEISTAIDHRDVHVLEEEGQIIAMISVVHGPDKSYEHIDGQWLNDDPYCAFHRVCVDEARKGQGIAARLFAFSEEYGRSLGYKNVRIDTHPDNRSMQRALAKYGFVQCGSLILAEGSEAGAVRLGYHKLM